MTPVLRWIKSHLVVVICAIVGGVYTLAGILDGVLETGHHVIKKARMGKQR